MVRLEAPMLGDVNVPRRNSAGHIDEVPKLVFGGCLILIFDKSECQFRAIHDR